MTRKIIFTALCGLAVVSALASVLFLWLPPAPFPRCRVVASTLAVTNDTSGTRQATFRLANVGRRTAAVMPFFGLENRSGHWRTDLLPPHAKTLRTDMMGVLPFHPRSKSLGRGESCEVTIPLPFDDRGWRASFWYQEIPSGLERTTDDLSKLFARIGSIKTPNAPNGLPTASTGWTDQ